MSRGTYQLVSSFVGEARNYLPTIRQHLADFAAGRSPASLEVASSYIQALRDASATIGLKSLRRLTMGLEAELDTVREGRSAMDAELLGRTRRILDDIDLALAGFHLQARRAPSASAAAPAVDEGLDPELLEIFRQEAEEGFLALARHFGELQERPGDPGTLREIRRRAHSLKGAAGTAGLSEASRLAHRMEDLLDALVEGRRQFDDTTLPLLLRTTDALQALIQGEMETDHSSALVEEIHLAYTELLGEPEVAHSGPLVASDFPMPASPVAPSGPEPAVAEPIPTERAAAGRSRADMLQAEDVEGRIQPIIRLSLDRYDAFQKLVGEMILNRDALEQHIRRLGEEMEECEAGVGRLERIAAWLEDEAAAGRPLLSGPKPAAMPAGAVTGSFPAVTVGDQGVDATIGDFDALELDRYSEVDLMSLQLTETTADLHTVASDLRALMRSFQTTLRRQQSLSRQLENRLTEGRLTSFDTLVPRLERAARLTASRQGKEVELAIEGRRVEVDRRVLEELTDTLVHLIRNAIGHGIETPAERRQAGKPATGRVMIRVVREGGVTITVDDDGRGLDEDAIRRAAARIGLLDEQELEGLRGRELHHLIFLPGLSTAGEIDEIAGRGVGMDVVEATVRRLHGDVDVTSQPGRGTSFVLRVPTSLASDRVLLVRAAGHTWAVPQTHVQEVVSRPTAELIEEGGQRWLPLRGKGTAVVPLSELLGLVAGEASGPEPGGSLTALLIERGGRRQAVAVEALLGSREVVVKPLGAHLEAVRGVLGATLLGGGELVLILNPLELAALAERPAALRRAAARAPRQVEPAKPRSVLVVDDSLSIRRAVADSVASAGWQPITARDGQEAFETLQQLAEKPVAIVLDIEMPRMDGYELTATLRAIEEFAQIPIVMLTSRAGDKHRHRAFAVGASEYLAKPYQEDVLLRTIHRLAAKRESDASR